MAKLKSPLRYVISLDDSAKLKKKLQSVINKKKFLTSLEYYISFLLYRNIFRNDHRND